MNVGGGDTEGQSFSGADRSTICWGSGGDQVSKSALMSPQTKQAIKPCSVGAAARQGGTFSLSVYIRECFFGCTIKGVIKVAIFPK